MDQYNYRYEQDDFYCYPGTTVLRNRLDIRDPLVLHQAEQEITNINLTELHRRPISGHFGFAHLCSIHRFLFQDIYEWAGKPRSDGFLSKGGTLFVRGDTIADTAKTLFSKLEEEHKLRNLPKEQFIERLAYYMGEVNALYPFREGNGRTAREFFRTLSLSAGYQLDYRLASKKELLDADIQAYIKNYSPLIAILNKAVEKQPRIRERER
ncbi:MAG: Fic family protein [Oscillospiraceae bacterium]|nr:Fic family protein [Oscillospiraceae bacterium]